MKAPLAGGLEWEPSCKKGELAGWSSKAMKKESWGQINRQGMELLLPHHLGLWHRLSKKNFPFGFKGNTPLPSDPGGTGHAPCSESQGYEHTADME